VPYRYAQTHLRHFGRDFAPRLVVTPCLH
jgi:hypothetical protein